MTSPKIIPAVEPESATAGTKFDIDYYGENNPNRPWWRLSQIVALLESGQIEDAELVAALRYGMQGGLGTGWYNHLPPDKVRLVNDLLSSEPAAIVAANSVVRVDLGKVFNFIRTMDPTVNGVMFTWEAKHLPTRSDASGLVWVGPTPFAIRGGEASKDPLFDDEVMASALGNALARLHQVLTELGRVLAGPILGSVEASGRIGEAIHEADLSHVFRFKVMRDDLNSYDHSATPVDMKLVAKLAKTYLGLDLREGTEAVYQELSSYLEGALSAFLWSKRVLSSRIEQASDTERLALKDVYAQIDAEHERLANDYMLFF
jgi:hypothetical protein